MIVFGWILWSMFILDFTFTAAVVVGTIIAFGQGNNVRVTIPFRIIFDIAVFIFLTMYLF